VRLRLLSAFRRTSRARCRCCQSPTLIRDSGTGENKGMETEQGETMMMQLCLPCALVPLLRGDVQTGV